MGEEERNGVAEGVRRERERWELAVVDPCSGAEPGDMAAAGGLIWRERGDSGGVQICSHWVFNSRESDSDCGYL